MKSKSTEHPPGNLVDGNKENYAYSYAQPDGIWIRVMLPELTKITRIGIVNRMRCCTDDIVPPDERCTDYECKRYIIGISVSIKMQDVTSDVVVTSCGTITIDNNFHIFKCVGRGNVVELRKDGDVDQQNIAEIEVFKDIPAPGYDILNNII